MGIDENPPERWSMPSPCASRLYRILVSLALLLVVPCAHAQMTSDFRLFSESFISPAFEDTQTSNYQFAALSLNSRPDTEDPFVVHAQGAVAFGAPLLNYLDVNELFYQNKIADGQTLFIGRKHMAWNDMDSRWDFGLWQPTFQWNPLSPEEQGLTGLFWQTQKDNYSVTMFVSPLFIPDQGPSFDIENGQFLPTNPWFHRPPDSVQIFSESTQVDYTIDKPSTTQVLLHTSYGAKLTVGSADGFQAQASYMYKPSNQLALTYSGVLDTSKLVGVVDLKPIVFYETLTGLDLTERIGPWRFGVSGMIDHPQNATIDADPGYTYPTFSDAALVSPFVEWSQPAIAFTLQSLNVYGGQVTEVGDMASPDRAPLTMLFPYQQAIKATMENRFALGGPRRLNSKLSYTISDKNDFEYLQWALNYRFSWVWSIFSELELVRAGDLTASNQNEIAQYRTDDRLMMGVAYVF